VPLIRQEPRLPARGRTERPGVLCFRHEPPTDRL